MRTRARISVVESDAHDMTTEGCEVLGNAGEGGVIELGRMEKKRNIRDLIVRKMDSDSKKAINELFIELI